jgi:hypothetical protein
MREGFLGNRSRILCKQSSTWRQPSVLGRTLGKHGKAEVHLGVPTYSSVHHEVVHRGTRNQAIFFYSSVCLTKSM